MFICIATIVGWNAFYSVYCMRSVSMGCIQCNLSSWKIALQKGILLICGVVLICLFLCYPLCSKDVSMVIVVMCWKKCELFFFSLFFFAQCHCKVFLYTCLLRARTFAVELNSLTTCLWFYCEHTSVYCLDYKCKDLANLRCDKW